MPKMEEWTKSTGSGRQTKGTLPCGRYTIPKISKQDPSIYPQAQPSPICFHTQPPPRCQHPSTEWMPLNTGLCLFQLRHVARAHLFPFTGQFIQHLLGTYLNSALDARNILHSSSYFNSLQRHFIIRKMRPREVN